MIKLKKLLKDLFVQDVKGSKDIEITGICSHSKRVFPGNLFVAKKGSKANGNDFIREAISAGASAILTDIFDPFLKQVTQVIHPNVSQIEASLAAEFYGHPSRKLWMVGITGTNGKTTTAYLIKYLLEKLGKGPCGLIGTIEYLIGNQSYRASYTTPDVCLNQKLLKEMCLQGCSSAVMEVSSHALDQKRVDQIHFDVGVFTNLSKEHLDYHHTMENYALAKSKLFSSLSKNSIAVINRDDSFADLMIQACIAPYMTYGLGSSSDLRAEDLVFSKEGISCKLTFKGQTARLNSLLIGKYNLYNLLASIAAILPSGMTLEEAVFHLQSFEGVLGRLQRVPNALGLSILVDFAHTPDALANVLKTLAELTREKLIVVFGCGGDRDPFKRPLMARIAEQLADVLILTSDNPRSEDPLQILEDMEKGLQQSKKHYKIVDRKEAIGKAISLASKEDTVLIAGKGHETTQIFSHQTIPFDDVAIASLCCQKRTDELLCSY